MYHASRFMLSISIFLDLGETCVKTALQNIPAIICGDQLVCTEAQPLPQCAYGLWIHLIIRIEQHVKKISKVIYR